MTSGTLAAGAHPPPPLPALPCAGEQALPAEAWRGSAHSSSHENPFPAKAGSTGAHSTGLLPFLEMLRGEKQSGMCLEKEELQADIREGL